MTLDNKLGLMDSIELAKMEEKISKTRAKELFEKQLPWKILTGCLSRPLSRLSRSTLS